MNHVKTLIVLLFLSLAATSASAQRHVFGTPNLMSYDDKIAHFGFLISGGTYNYVLYSNPNLLQNDSLHAVNPQSGKSFGFGIIADLRLGKYFDLRFIPSFTFPDCQLRYFRTGTEFQPDYANGNANGIVFLDIPVLVKFKSTRMLNNMRAYVLAGAQYSRNLVYGKASKMSQNNANGILLVNANDVAAQVGVGLDFYCTYFKLATELKFSLGLINQLQKEGHFEGSIQSLRSKAFLFSITFE